MSLVFAAPLTPVAAESSPDGVVREERGRVDMITPTQSTVVAAPMVVPCPSATTIGPASGWVISGVVPGRVFSVTADAGTWRDDFDISFYDSLASCQAGTGKLRYRNHAGDENSVVPDGASVALVTLNSGTPGAAFTYRELGDDPLRPQLMDQRTPTVIAVIDPVGDSALGDAGFSPYHNDFLGSLHPWNTDGVDENNLDFTIDPTGYINGYPGSTPLQLTFPENENENVSGLADGVDAPQWNSMEATVPGGPAKLYRFPGTKVIGAIGFNETAGTGNISSSNDAHGTLAASVSGGNIYGACPECLFVFVGILGEAKAAAAAIEWARQQPWIDVITNSYGHSITAYDKVYLGNGEPASTKAGVVNGQTITWSAGNGVENSSTVPVSTYWSAQKGPDWVVTVGSANTTSDQGNSGSGKPADIGAYGDSYPSAGGTTLNGRGGFSGTSNASPVVAGTFAKVIQLSRDLLGDTTSGTSGGIVAAGKPQRCPVPTSPCPLDDGVLERKELQDLVFANVLPTPLRQFQNRGTLGNEVKNGSSGVTPLPSYLSVGHGVVYGRQDPARFVAEQRRLSDALRGAVHPYTRPPGEAAWMKVDSKCRQRLWGSWGEGLYAGTDPTFDAQTDALAMTLNTACSALPQDTLLNVPVPEAPPVEDVCTNSRPNVCINLSPLRDRL